MALVDTYYPPAYMPDFNGIPGLLEAWSSAVSDWFDGVVASEQMSIGQGQVQYFNGMRTDPGGQAVEQAIVWNAFPKELLRQFGRERALREADALWTLDKYYSVIENDPVDVGRYPIMSKTYFRPLDEYCEWHISRDANTGTIDRITFSSEPPEYWYALFGGSMPGDNHVFPGSPERVLQLYRELVSPDVQMEDLIAPETIDSPQGPFAVKGQYNPYNKWNTTHGIAHLNAPPNSLLAEIQLGGDATVLRKNKAGVPMVEPDSLVCCAGYGGPDRNSDPTIGAAVNALARLGAMITLRNPVGLYMDHIDLSGWAAPDGKGVDDCVRIVRGMPNLIERLVVEVPAERGFSVSDITIAGEPILYGGQIAECISVKLVGVAHIGAQPVQNQPLPCQQRCVIDKAHASRLASPIGITSPVPIGDVVAFVGQGAAEMTARRKPAAVASVESVAEPPKVSRMKSRFSRWLSV